MTEPVTLDWNPVTKSHPSVGTPNVNVTVLSYEVVGEIEREGKKPEVLVFSAVLPRNVTEFVFPESFTALVEDEMKFEIVTKAHERQPDRGRELLRDRVISTGHREGLCRRAASPQGHRAANPFEEQS